LILEMKISKVFISIVLEGCLCLQIMNDEL